MAGPEPLGEYPTELEEFGEGRLVGVSAEGDPLYYDAAGERTVHAEERDGHYQPDLTTEYYLTESESLGDVVARVEDAVGWAALTPLGERA